MKKTRVIHELMYRLAKGDELTINTKLAHEFETNTKTLGRYLDEIIDDYSDIITVENKKILDHSRQPSVYRAIDQKRDLAVTLQFFFERRTELGWVLQLLHEKDPMLAIDGEYKNEINKLISQESNIFVFKSTPFEILDDRHQKIFAQLKNAIKFNKHKTISYHYNHIEHLQDVKCLKLIFTQNNWYLAIEDKEKLFRLLRVSFIEDVSLSDKGDYQKSKMQKYEHHYKNIQNAMTLHNQPIKKAKCKASPRIAMYFQKEMKPFLISQKYLKTCDDGSVDFELSYTQPLEILPFVKQWLPDIQVLEPASLIDDLKQDILQAYQDYSS